MEDFYRLQQSIQMYLFLLVSYSFFTFRCIVAVGFPFAPFYFIVFKPFT